MTVTLASTSKIVKLDGIRCRLWEGVTGTGIKVHAYIPRIAHSNEESEEVIQQFREELEECQPPSLGIEAIPFSLIL